MLYRFGFLLYPAACNDALAGRIAASGLERWRRLSLGELEIVHHPESTVTCRDAGETSVCIIGDAFSTKEASLSDAIGSLTGLTLDEAVQEVAYWSGRFAAILRKGSAYVVLHDPFGARTVFFSRTTQCVSSHAGLLARVFAMASNKLAQNIVSSSEYKGRSVKYLPGNITLFKDVQALPPNFSLDLVEMKMKRYWPVRRVARRTVPRFYEELDQYFCALARHLVAKRAPVIVGVTGGADGRALLSALLSRGVTIAGATWGGAYVNKKELPVIDEVIKRTGIFHQTVEVDGPVDETVANIANANVGGQRGASRLTASMSRYFTPNGIFIRGYGGEIIRGFYNLMRQPLENLSTAEMVRAYNSSAKTEVGASFLSILHGVFDEFGEMCGYEGLAETAGSLCLDVNDIFYWEHRMGMWAANMHNEMDAAVLSMTGFNSRRSFEAAFGLDKEIRLTKRVLADYASKNVPELAGLRWL